MQKQPVQNRLKLCMYKVQVCENAEFPSFKRTAWFRVQKLYFCVEKEVQKNGGMIPQSLTCVFN